MFVKAVKSISVAVTAVAVMMLTVIFGAAVDGYTRIDVEDPGMFSVRSVDDGADGASALPSSFDLRNYGCVTPVKNQALNGTCWAFSVMAASESSLIKEFGGRFNTSLDLSELHLSYFTMHKSADSLGLTNGDYSYVASIFSNYLSEGGNNYLANFALAKWIGPVYESTLPYENATAGLSLSEQLSFNSDVAHLENTRWISMKDMDEIKSTIMSKGAVSVSYYSEDRVYLNDKTGAYYYDKSSSATNNHAVTIIGWNDNYSRLNFGGASGSRTKPSEDGAWLVKSSYGTDYGKDGYIWISYEDKSILSEVAFSFDYGLSDNYKYNYQYDGGSVMSYYRNESVSRMANVFTAKSDEILKAVSFYTTEPGISYSVSIYTGVTGNSSPVAGTLEKTASTSGKCKYAGYHTVKLPAAVTLDRGEKYSVVINLTDGGSPAAFLVDYTNKASGSVYSVTTSAKGESFLGNRNGAWSDLYANGKNENLRIKAFTDPGFVRTSSISLSKSKMCLGKGEASLLTVAAKPANANGRMVWKSSNTSVATVSSSGKVTAVSDGSCVITATSVYGSHKAQCAVTVSSSKVMNIKASNVYNTCYTLGWRAIPGAAGYQVFVYSSNLGRYVYMKTVRTAACTVSGLPQGRKSTYMVRAIFAKNGATVCGEMSDPFEVTTRVAMGKTLCEADKTDTTVSLKWTALPSAGFYRIYMTQGDSKSFSTVKLASGNSAVIYGLSPNTKYTFRVTACISTASGMYEGSASNNCQVVTRLPAATGLSVHTATGNSVIFTWQRVTGATGYNIYRYNAASGKWTNVFTTSATLYAGAGLESGTQYYYKVRPFVKLGDGTVVYGQLSETLRFRTK